MWLSVFLHTWILITESSFSFDINIDIVYIINSLIILYCIALSICLSWICDCDCALFWCYVIVLHDNRSRWMSNTDSIPLEPVRRSLALESQRHCLHESCSAFNAPKLVARWSFWHEGTQGQESMDANTEPKQFVKLLFSLKYISCMPNW